MCRGRRRAWIRELGVDRRLWVWLGVLGGLVAIVVLGGCTPKALTGKPVDLYAVQGGLQHRPAPDLEPAGPAVGPEAPYVPVMNPPRVQRVWIPATINEAGDLVSGHWVYLELRPSRWFLDDGAPEPEKGIKLNVPSGLAVRPPHHVLRISPAQLGGGEGAATPDGGQAGRKED